MPTLPFGTEATTRNLFPHSGLQAFRCEVPLISASFAAFAKVLHLCDAAEYIESRMSSEVIRVRVLNKRFLQNSKLDVHFTQPLVKVLSRRDKRTLYLLGISVF